MSMLTRQQIDEALDKGIGSIYTKEDVKSLLDNLKQPELAFTEESMKLLLQEATKIFDEICRQADFSDADVELSLNYNNEILVESVFIDISDHIDIEDIIIQSIDAFEDKVARNNINIQSTTETPVEEQERLINEINLNESNN